MRSLCLYSKELTSEQVDTLLQMADMFDRMKTTVTDHDERMGEYQAILGQVRKYFLEPVSQRFLDLVKFLAKSGT